jgi:hypothetical protein
LKMKNSVILNFQESFSYSQEEILMILMTISNFLSICFSAKVQTAKS